MFAKLKQKIEKEVGLGPPPGGDSSSHLDRRLSSVAAGESSGVYSELSLSVSRGLGESSDRASAGRSAGEESPTIHQSGKIPYITTFFFFFPSLFYYLILGSSNFKVYTLPWFTM